MKNALLVIVLLFSSLMHAAQVSYKNTLGPLPSGAKAGAHEWNELLSNAKAYEIACCTANLITDITPDNKLIVTALFMADINSAVIKIFDIQELKVARQFEAHTQEITAIELSRDGSFFVTGSKDMEVKIWNTLTGECRNVLKGHYDEITSLAISSDDVFLVTASDSGEAIALIWHIATGQLLGAAIGHTDRIDSVQITRDNHFIATMTHSEIKVWEMPNCKESYTLKGENFVSMVISNNAKFMVTISGDAVGSIWDFKTGQLLQEFVAESGLRLAQIAMRSDCEYFVAGYQIIPAYPRKPATHTCMLYDFSGNIIRKLAYCDSVTAIKISDDSSLILIGCEPGDNNLVTLWDFKSGSMLGALNFTSQTSAPNQTNALSANTLQHKNDRVLLRLSQDGTLIVFKNARGTRLKVVQLVPKDYLSSN